MPEDPEKREGEEEEFEPLDKFFAPIEDVDWPEVGEEVEGGSGSEHAHTVEPGLDEDLLPHDIPDDPLADLDAEDFHTEPVAGQEALQLEVPEPSPAVTQETDLPDWDRDETSSGTEETWEDDAAAAMTETRPALPEPDRELTLEDMKNAPPEYADLPGPPEDEPPAAGRFVPDEEVAAGAEEPELREVEAAADRLAAALRSEEPEEQPPPVLEPTAPVSAAHEVEQDLLADLDRDSAPPPMVTVGGPETLGGPSWQEPTSEEVSTAPPPGPLSGRNLPLAVLSGLVLVAIGVGAIAWGKAPFTVVAGAVIVLGQGELYAALHRKGYQPATALGLVFGGLISAASYLRGTGGAIAMFALGTMFTFLWFMAIPAKARQNTLANVAATILPLAWIALLGGFLMAILAMPGGRVLMLSTIGLAVGYDIAALAIGGLWGSRPLAPSISPRKSWEGAVGATLVLLLVSVGIVAALDPFKLGGNAVARAIGLALVISVAAPLGDLAESMVKRDLGLKDMGSLIPGHGGILDRIDSILFAAPAAFYFFRLVLS